MIYFYEVKKSSKIFGLGSELPGIFHLLSNWLKSFFSALKVIVSVVRTLGFDCTL